MKKASFLPYVEVFWIEEINAVQLKWQQLHLSLEKFKEVTDTAMQMLSIHKSSTWIADQYNSNGAFNKKIIEFITNELVGTAVGNYDVKLVLTIMPKEKGISSLNTKRWMTDVQEMGAFTMANFATIEDCKEWVRENS